MRFLGVALSAKILFVCLVWRKMYRRQIYLEFSALLYHTQPYVKWYYHPNKPCACWKTVSSFAIDSNRRFLLFMLIQMRFKRRKVFLELLSFFRWIFPDFILHKSHGLLQKGHHLSRLLRRFDFTSVMSIVLEELADFRREDVPCLR
jgi:hypothetical protein